MANSHSSTKRNSPLALEIIVSCVLVFFIIGASFWWLINQYRPKPHARIEMRHFMQQLKLGETKNSVQKKFKAGNYRVLKLRDSAVITPFEMGAGNWQLHMEFQKEKLMAARLRVADGIKFRPREEDAPPDQVAPGWESPYSDETWGLN